MCNDIRSDFMKKTAVLIVGFLVISAFMFTGAFAGVKPPLKPSEKDKCAVCGMFVAKYPDWVSQIIFRDGARAFFAGPKDMFKYYVNMKKYDSSKAAANVDSIYVKDYYSLSFIDARAAWFVMGSDVYGPMGNELVAFEKEAGAKEFLRDHKGRKILRMKEITAEILKGLDE